MSKTLKIILIAAAVVLGLAVLFYAFSDSGSDQESTKEASGAAGAKAGEDHEEGGPLEMSAAEREAKGIATAPVERRALAAEFIVPGEVMMNLYQSAQVTPRIGVQVVKRHAKLGDKVKAGQPLVTLSSVEVADAQGALIVNDREWRRVKTLGRDVVSERRYVEAQVAAEQSNAKLLAYGMTPEQIAALRSQGDASKATGEFQLLSPQDGVIIRDAFVVGEVVEAGRLLFEISDESRIWVKAQLTAEQATHVALNDAARILIGTEEVATGHVVQAYHRLEETTRTQPVRIEVDNKSDALHPGQFVNVAIAVGEGAPVLAVPTAAVVLMDGAQTVFKVQQDILAPTSIEIGERRGDWTEVKSGLALGDEIVVSNAFLLKSLIQKTKMGDAH
ncbi:MAG: efflux RND transporter periplasmic adaptor subunit [Pseudomonadota bacterium]